MIRRIALAAVTGALCAALVVPSADAFTRRQAICVKGARARAKQSIVDCRTQAADKLAEDLSACLNDTDGCVAGPNGCIAQQAACQSATQTTSGPCRQACKDANATASNACGNAADPLACVANAQLALFTCNQACAAQVEPDIITCNGNFNDCLQTCSNPDTTTTTTLP